MPDIQQADIPGVYRIEGSRLDSDRDSVVVLAGYWYARKPEITAGKISLSAHNVNVTSSHESDIDLSNGYHTWEHSPRRCSFKSL
ncbi:hypothetical protein VTP01DRAFT_4677 [Rhizomucor pusillus]|uniref:uncharacterized protein n=1 Tax=Rhizomucor pusillus TaxID=4840 RepID=UPI0037431F64